MLAFQWHDFLHSARDADIPVVSTHCFAHVQTSEEGGRSRVYKSKQFLPGYNASYFSIYGRVGSGFFLLLFLSFFLWNHPQNLNAKHFSGCCDDDGGAGGTVVVV